jgi:hypothetical protein
LIKTLLGQVRPVPSQKRLQTSRGANPENLVILGQERGVFNFFSMLVHGNENVDILNK